MIARLCRFTLTVSACLLFAMSTMAAAADAEPWDRVWTMYVRSEQQTFVDRGGESYRLLAPGQEALLFAPTVDPAFRRFAVPLTFATRAEGSATFGELSKPLPLGDGAALLERVAPGQRLWLTGSYKGGRAFDVHQVIPVDRWGVDPVRGGDGAGAPGNWTWTLDEAGVLTIAGTPEDDVIVLGVKLETPAAEGAPAAGVRPGVTPYDTKLDRAATVSVGGRRALGRKAPLAFTGGKATRKGELGGVTRIVVRGGEGDDLLICNSKRLDFGVELDGGPGNDLLQGGSGADLISGGEGDDTIRGGRFLSFCDRLDGGPGYDVLTNGMDTNTRHHLDRFGPECGIERILSFHNTSVDGSDGDNVFDFSRTALDHIGGVHPFYQRSFDGDDEVWTSPTLLRRPGSRPPNYSGGAGTDTVHIVLTPAQYAKLTAAQLAALRAYVKNPTTIMIESPEAGLRFGLGGFERADIRILLTEGSALHEVGPVPESEYPRRR